MAKREQFNTNMVCPACGKSGAATWEENENPVYASGDGTKLVALPVGFRRGQARDISGKPEIICIDCNKPI